MVAMNFVLRALDFFLCSIEKTPLFGGAMVPGEGVIFPGPRGAVGELLNSMA
jgi:hypothetical protein